MLIEDKSRIEEQYSAWLSDESRTGPGRAEALLLPETLEEAAGYLKNHTGPVTISGGRSGITGGAVPCGGTLLSTTGLKSIEGPFERDGKQLVRVGAGVTLSDLKAHLQNSRLFYPPDPTEESAGIGGTIATNASGARSYKYGATREHVASLELVTVQGDILRLERGRTPVTAGCFVLPDGTSRLAPAYAMPSAKTAAGYYSRPDMDLIDLIIGSEGTLAVVTGAELYLQPAPQERMGLLIFFPSEKDAFTFAVESSDIDIENLEYFDGACLRLLQEEDRLPGSAGQAGAAIMLEQIMDGKDPETVCLQWEEILNKCGSSLDECLYRLDDAGIEQLRAIRHALPEAVNNRVSANRLREPSVYKLGTDTSVPSHSSLKELITVYRSRLTEIGVEHYIFGHLGEHHLHVNLLPSDASAMEISKPLVTEFAEEAVRHGGCVSAEHGIGRIKRHLLKVQYPDSVLEEMLKIKRDWDPEGRLNPGVLFD